MSKYTTEVRFICETEAGLTNSVGYSGIESVLNKAVNKIFSFDFPIFDERYRIVLCKKILKHYYTREICEETYGLWKLRLDARMNEIMPYFNKLYESELIKFNPMHDTNVSRKGNRSNTGKDKQTTNASSNGTYSHNNSESITSSGNSHVTDNGTDRDLYSDTPQGSLTNVENETYLTNARKKINSNTTDTNSSNSTTTNGSGGGNSQQTAIGTQEKNAESTEDYIETITGKHGGLSYSKMLMEYRDTFLNIDMQVIEKLSDLFFGLW